MVELGVSREIAGGGGIMVKATALEVPPPGAGVETVTLAVPAVATSAVVMAACKAVLETPVVVRGLPFHRTVEKPKFVPVTVRVKAPLPATTAFGLNEVTAGTGLLL